MKKTLLSLLALFAIAGCSDKSIDGKIVGESELNPNTAQKIVYRVPKGRQYTLQDESGKLYLAIVTNGEDPLNEGNEGSFNLGKKLFAGSFERYEDGQRKTHKITAYQLDSYSIK